MRRTLLATALTVGAFVGAIAPMANAASPRIVDGREATASEAPWAVALYGAASDASPDGFHCSASLISAEWVLTAKHCLDPNDRAHIGNHDRANGTEIKIDKKIGHPSADIALIKLVSASDSKDFAPLADTAPKSGDTNEIFGWGLTSKTDQSSKPAAKLKTATVTVTNVGSEIASTGKSGYAWKGDSGGPQVANGKQVGVASTASVIGKDQNYVSVAQYRDWIRQQSGV